MQPIYFAHGYREREAAFAEFFGTLMQQTNLIPSLDPPSNMVNSAKLERHLGYTKGLVAVLASRGGTVSPHILFEISMCIRSGQPVLAFVEDSLPNEILPRQILQRRFSPKSFVRETREHAHALEIFETYIGKDHIPRYEPSVERRSCMLIGMQKLGKDYLFEIKERLGERGYDVFDAPRGVLKLPLPSFHQAKIRSASLAICLLDDRAPASMYFLGAARTCLRPTLLFSKRRDFPLNPDIPNEYQYRFLPPDDIDLGIETIVAEIELFEEDFVELDRAGEAAKYAQQLRLSASSAGKYSDSTRTMIVEELTMGDKYTGTGVGVQGPNAHAHDMKFTQTWNNLHSEIDLGSLSRELKALRDHLRPIAEEPDHDASIGAIAKAEIEAEKGNGPGVIEALSTAGRWAFDNATKIGVSVAAAALKSSLGY